MDETNKKVSLPFKSIIYQVVFITLIPCLLVLLNFFQSNSSADYNLSDWVYIIVFNVCITIVLTLLTNVICQLLRHYYPWKKSGFTLKIAFQFLILSIAATLVMYFYSELWYTFIVPEWREENATLVNILIAVAITLIVSVIYEAKHVWEMWKTSLLREKDLLNENLSTQLEVLKAQINPHFLFNTLNGIYVLIKQNPEKARENTIKLSELLSHQIYDSKKHLIPLEKELEYLKNYMDLEKTRQEDQVKVCCDFPDETNNTQIPPLLFVPFVENAFKHGLSSANFPYQINISIKIKDGVLSFKCENDCGPTKVKPNKDSGFGLQNVRKRLDLIFGTHHDLWIQEENFVYLVHLKINLDQWNHQYLA